MIYCVVPEELADELYDKLVSYYADDDNVSVIVERRSTERRRAAAQDGPTRQQRELRDRRRARVAGEFPALDGPASERNGDE